MLALLFLVFKVAQGFWTLNCESELGVARIDPIVAPGSTSAHAHIIYGAGAIDQCATFESLRRSSCTSCAIEQDLSAYWTPPLMFMHHNGTVEMVAQRGLVVYYLLHGSDIQPFPEGFRMIAGNDTRRDFSLPVPDPPFHQWDEIQRTQSALSQKAIGFNCINASRQSEPSLSRHFLPTKDYLDANCSQIRLEVMFPSCWDGVTNGDPGVHLRYPDHIISGICPVHFPIRIPSLLYETYFQTSDFRDIDGAFYLANHDNTGFGYHGDFISGWDKSILREAIQTCTNGSRAEDCPLFTLQTMEQMRACTLNKTLTWENCRGPRDGLCGY